MVEKVDSHANDGKRASVVLNLKFQFLSWDWFSREDSSLTTAKAIFQLDRFSSFLYLKKKVPQAGIAL